MNLCQPVNRPCFICGATLPEAGVAYRDCMHFEPVHIEIAGGVCAHLRLGTGICDSDAAREALTLDRRYRE